MRSGGAIAAVAALMWTGCGEQPSSRAAQEIVAPDEAESDPNAPVAAATGAASLDEVLALKAKRYAKDWSGGGPAIRGELREGGRSDHLLVLRAGFCYRVIGVGGDGVEDLDLLLFDPNGVQVQQDPAQDRFPVLGMQSEICPAVGAAFRLQAVMYKGSGAFVAGVYKTPS